jgi:lysozyme
MIEDIELIQRWESCKLKAYKDIASIWTIGWGSIILYGRPVRRDDVIIQNVADTLLHIEVLGIRSKLRLLINRELNSNHYIALTDFVYNLGMQAFKDSTLRKLINSGYQR